MLKHACAYTSQSSIVQTVWRTSNVTFASECKGTHTHEMVPCLQARCHMVQTVASCTVRSHASAHQTKSLRFYKQNCIADRGSPTSTCVGLSSSPCWLRPYFSPRGKLLNATLAGKKRLYTSKAGWHKNFYRKLKIEVCYPVILENLIQD